MRPRCLLLLLPLLSLLSLSLSAEPLSRGQTKRRVREDVLRGGSLLNRLPKELGLALAGFGPLMPWQQPLPPLQAEEQRAHAAALLLAGALGALLTLGLLKATRRRPIPSSVPAPSAPPTTAALSYGGRDPLVSIAFKLLNSVGDGRLTLPQLIEGSKMMWDVAAPALGEIIGMKGDFPERMTEDADLGSRREGAVAKIFYEMDDDSDGVVSEADFQRFVRSVRFTYDPVLTVFFNLIDVTGSGTVNQKEFASAITPVHAVAKEATLLAMGIDPAATDSPFAASGAASTEHTRATAAAALRKALATTFAEIDRNGDGAVSLDEFQRHFQALALKVY
mmetsp:Transcript_10501/g.28973  ORF Transcript_10501/g.28973 Transcript_10501/m.28973 type:complete len:336 (+) Transcript_10501:2344-3351(+)